MPQMSPMIWFIFPFIMMGLVLISVVTLNVELNWKSENSWGGVSGVKYLKW